MSQTVSTYEFLNFIQFSHQETRFNKSHAIFEKDVFRVMKTDKLVDKTLVKKPSGVKTILEYNNNKYKTRSQLIME